MVGLIAGWAIVAWKLLHDNIGLLETLPAWKAAVATVIIILGAPAFFLSDILEYSLDIVTEEDEECQDE